LLRSKKYQAGQPVSDLEKEKQMISTQRQFIEEFCKEHGNHVQDPKSNLLLFEDGAVLEVGDFGLGVSREPSTDAYERCKVIARFHAIRLATAVKDFDEYKQGLLHQAHFAERNSRTEFLPDRDSVIGELKRMRGICMRLNKQLNKANAEVERHKPDWLVKREQEMSEAHERVNSFRADVTSIQI
jgi:hypothetical protein